MREKSEFRAPAHASPDADADRIRCDLEDRGMAPEFSRPVAQRLVAIAADLSTPEYAAILDGVSAAYGVHRDISEFNDEHIRQGNELQRLMNGFTGEVRKLDEGLRMLSAYLVRMSALMSHEESGNLH